MKQTADPAEAVDPRPFIRSAMNCVMDRRAGDAMLVLDSAVRSGCDSGMVLLALMDAVCDLVEAVVEDEKEKVE